MKRIIATILSAMVGLFGYAIVDTAIEARVSSLESRVAYLESVVEEYHEKEDDLPETDAPGTDNEMTKAEFVTFVNAETAKAANGSYNFNRTCSYTEPIDVGNATDALNSVIKMVDKNSDLNSVVGGFLGIGTKTSAYPTDGLDDNYKLKATTLKEPDVQNFTAKDGVYSFTLANAANPKKTGATPFHRFTNDFITHEEVDSGIKDTAGSLIKLNSTDVDYTNIKVSVTVEDGKITKINYQYDFAAALDIKATLILVHGYGAAKLTTTYSNIKY